MTKLHNILEILSNEAKQELRKGLQDGSIQALLTETKTLNLDLQEHQVVPDGDWQMYALLGGRGAGKTYATTAWAAQKLMEQGDIRIGVVVPSYRDARNFVDYVLQHIPAEYSPKYQHLLSRLELSNGSSISFYATGSTHMRGACFHYGVVSEAQEQFRHGRDGSLMVELLVGTRLGEKPRVFVEGSHKRDGSDELIGCLQSMGALIRYTESEQNSMLSKAYLRNLRRMQGQ